MSSPSSSNSGHAPAVASSSRTPLSVSPREEENEDGLELNDDELLAEDPLHENGSPDGRVSFKSNLLPASPSLASRFLPSPFLSRHPSSSSYSVTNARSATPNTILSYLNTGASDPYASGPDAKDTAGLDWYVEGPGRRVGYDNLTAIDWIYEYSKERQRQRMLVSASPGLIGQLRLAVDKSQIWWILIATGLSVGGIAAGIDVVSDWLGDLKMGVCSDVQDGGRFYLNRAFCCWEMESYAGCADWRTWPAAMGIGNEGGSYVVEYLLFVCFSILFATIASLLVTKFSLFAKQSGIPEIKTVLGGFVIRHFLGAWTLVIKSLGLCFSVASGMWLGKEGPMVHVACCCANLFMKLFDGINGNEARKREVLSAAAASGISVAFGAPIGGVLFSLEQLSYYFPDKTMWAAFVCAMVAAMTLHALDPFHTGKLVLFQLTHRNPWHAFELVPFVVVGIIGGLYGAMFIKLNMRVAAWRISAKNPFLKRPVWEVIVVAALTAGIGFPITFLRAQSTELVEFLFAECKNLQDDVLGLCKEGIANTGVIFILLISAVLGFFLASITFGLQLPAGILMPSMAVGALYGRVVGLIMEVWQQRHPSFFAFSRCALEPETQCITPGTYAVIGAASALAGATKMTVSIVVIMFELTGALTYVLPIMVAVMVSKWVADAFGHRGIYESWIHFQGYPFLDNHDDTPVPDVPVAQLMTRIEDLVCITATGHTIASLRNLLRENSYRGFPVVNDSAEATLLGYISRTELAYALNTATSSSRGLPPSTPAFFAHQPLADPTVTLDLRPWMDQTPLTLSARSSLQLTNDMFQKLGLRWIFFVERAGVLAGLMTKKDLWFVLDEGGREGKVGRGVGALREEGYEGGLQAGGARGAGGGAGGNGGNGAGGRGPGGEEGRGLLGHRRDDSEGVGFDVIPGG